MRILIVDSVCPRPYDGEILRTEPLGGTEATVIRVAQGLSLRPEVESVYVFQHNRAEESAVHVRYVGPGSARPPPPTHVIVLRRPELLPRLGSIYPSAKLYLWAHDLFALDRWREGIRHCQDANAVVICVSAWHQRQLMAAARMLGTGGSIRATFVHNPIDDELEPDDTVVDPNKLLFYSSPHKGLANTLRIFAEFAGVAELDSMVLYVANPGYLPDLGRAVGRVVALGALSHDRAIAHVRSAFAVLHMNSEHPETFGLVHAEANAVGTPFLTAAFGATPEICPNPAQFVDVTDPRQVIDRLRNWKSGGRPTVVADPALRLSEVIPIWLAVLSQ